MKEEIKAQAEKIAGDIKAIKEQLTESGGIKGGFAVIPHVVKAVEAHAAEVKGMSSEDKKDLAVATINLLVDIPYLPEAVEGIVIGFAIDMLISAVNKWFGKDWLDKIVKA